MQKLILLVEDNPDDEALTMRAIRKQTGIPVVVTRDGAEALDFLLGTGDYRGRDLSVVPSLILLDLKLPKLNGLDVLRRIREDEETHNIPVVVFTSSTEERDVRESYRLGANSYICKQVDFNKFCSDLEQIITYWFNLSRLPSLAPFTYIREP
jgi:two-component system, response regulator